MKNYSTYLCRLFVCLLSLCIGSQYAGAKPFQIMVVKEANFSQMGWEKKFQDLIYTGHKSSIPDHPNWKEPGYLFLTNDDGHRNQTIPVTNKTFDGIKLREITKLQYSTYVEECPNVYISPSAPKGALAPALLLQLNLGGDPNLYETGIDCTINYFPQKQPDFMVEMKTWQDWNALAGKWRFGPDLKDPERPDFGKGNQFFNIQQVLDHYEQPGSNFVVTLLGDPNKAPVTGGIKFVLPQHPLAGTPEEKFTVGDYDNYAGCIDGFILNTKAFSTVTISPTGLNISYDFSVDPENFWIKFLKKYGIAIIAVIVVIWGCFRILRNIKYRKTKQQ